MRLSASEGEVGLVAPAPRRYAQIVPSPCCPRGQPMQCSKCGHENRSGAKFCEECGTRLARTCPKCQCEISPSAKFCPECGEQVAAPTSNAARVPSPKSYTCRAQELDPRHRHADC